MRTRIFTLLVALLCLPLVGWGQSVWNGTTDVSWYNEGQTEFTITTAEQLAGLAELINEDEKELSGVTINLGADIILNENFENYEDWGNNAPDNKWIPIGFGSLPWDKSFKGTFDGKNHSIKGIYMKRTSGYSGLFGSLKGSGIIKNLKVENSYVYSSASTVAAICGYCSNIISNCESNAIVIGEEEKVGGICGSLVGGKIENSINKGTVICIGTETDFTNNGIGGICGTTRSGGGSLIPYIENCYNLGEVNGSNYYTGGVIGNAAAESQISNCVNAGKITGTSDYTGGVIGGIGSTGIKISQCYNTGEVVGTIYTGGIVGGSNPSFSSYEDVADISYCYNTGTISGTKNIGGISGGNKGYPNKLENCFNAGLIKCNDSNAGGITGYFGNKKNSVTNCYYLEGTAEKGIGDDKATAEIKTASELAALITSTLFTTENGWSGDNASYTTTDTYTHTLKLPTFTTGNYVEVPIYEVHLENAGEAITSSLKQGTVKDGICSFTKNNDEEITITQQPANSPFTEWESGVAFSMPANDLVVSVKEKAYTITIQDPYDEQISSSHEKATEGTTITLSPIEEGKEIKDFIISYEKDGAITEETIQGNTFEMPASDVEIISVTFVEPEQPGDEDDEQGDDNTPGDIHNPQRPIKYYNIYVDTICPGLDVEVSKDVVQEGHQVSAYLTIQSECDTTDMRFEYKRGLFGYWQDLKALEGVQPGEYIIKNIYTDIYIRALDATLPEEEPTGIEDVEGVKAYAKEGNIYVYTPNREEVTIISMSGAIIKHAEQIGMQSYSVSRGIYIVRIGEKVFKLKN